MGGKLNIHRYEKAGINLKDTTSKCALMPLFRAGAENGEGPCRYILLLSQSDEHEERPEEAAPWNRELQKRRFNLIVTRNELYRWVLGRTKLSLTDCDET